MTMVDFLRVVQIFAAGIGLTVVLGLVRQIRQIRHDGNGEER